MRTTLATPAARTQRNSVPRDFHVPRPTPAKVSIRTKAMETNENNPVTPDEPFLALIDEARVFCGMSQKEMALNAQVNFGHFSEAMSGKRHFSVAWLDAQPFEFREAIGKIIAKKYGASRETQRAVVLRRMFSAINDLVAMTEVDLVEPQR